MQQYFINSPAVTELTISDKATIKHMFHVMRLSEGDQVIIVFTDHQKYLAQVTDSQAYTLAILERLPDSVELPVEVTIASGFPKGDKLDLITQKVTELGAHAIWAFPADWSVVKWDSKKLTKKEEKLAKIALGAAEQSKRNRLPAVRLFPRRADFLAQLSDFDCILVAYEEAAKRGEQAALARAFSQIKPGQKLLLVFGPEGGLSPQEVTQLEAAGAQLVGLGPRIMRTETAPLYALSALSYALELQG
ncbi:16S rRNA (uracil(1498)-N(3))-methyltransferase [Streptococcus halichoeri]|uniref:16S rRNA (uracil(1498)-N(3))-methyltransferase n=1 Tax=Streptococcus halichoeri TaxID=254785 RepID=UPI00135B7BA4|nr:16S rRNA (uracil(1498)-N(3))-methyltransferase [Streptococcus halichoeri]